MTRRASRHSTRVSGSKEFPDFVCECVAKKGSCSEPDAFDWICDSYKREYAMRYAAREMALAAKKTSRHPEKNAGVRFIEGFEITEQEAEHLYSLGLRRILTDLTWNCRKKDKRRSVVYIPETKTFVCVKDSLDPLKHARRTK
jgi:hypothetical protein